MACEKAIFSRECLADLAVEHLSERQVLSAFHQQKDIGAVRASRGFRFAVGFIAGEPIYIKYRFERIRSSALGFSGKVPKIYSVKRL